MQLHPRKQRFTVGWVAAAGSLFWGLVVCRADENFSRETMDGRGAALGATKTTEEKQPNKAAGSMETAVLAAVRRALEADGNLKIVEMTLDASYAGSQDTYLVNVELVEKDGRPVTIGVLATVERDPAGGSKVVSLAFVD